MLDLLGVYLIITYINHYVPLTRSRIFPPVFQYIILWHDFSLALWLIITPPLAILLCSQQLIAELPPRSSRFSCDWDVLHIQSTFDRNFGRLKKKKWKNNFYQTFFFNFGQIVLFFCFHLPKHLQSRLYK